MHLDLMRFVCAQKEWGWAMWPFGPGSGGGFWPTVARYGVSLVFLLLIALFLRLMFGPGGPLRPKEFGTEHIEERKRRKAELKELKARYKRGEVDAGEYFERRAELYKDE